MPPAHAMYYLIVIYRNQVLIKATFEMFLFRNHFTPNLPYLHFTYCATEFVLHLYKGPVCLTNLKPLSLFCMPVNNEPYLLM